jgi:hypothetical protein
MCVCVCECVCVCVCVRVRVCARAITMANPCPLLHASVVNRQVGRLPSTQAGFACTPRFGAQQDSRASRGPHATYCRTGGAAVRSWPCKRGDHTRMRHVGVLLLLLLLLVLYMRFRAAARLSLVALPIPSFRMKPPWHALCTPHIHATVAAADLEDCWTSAASAT